MLPRVLDAAGDPALRAGRPFRRRLDRRDLCRRRAGCAGARPGADGAAFLRRGRRRSPASRRSRAPTSRAICARGWRATTRRGRRLLRLERRLARSAASAPGTSPSMPAGIACADAAACRALADPYGTDGAAADRRERAARRRCWRRVLIAGVAPFAASGSARRRRWRRSRAFARRRVMPVAGGMQGDMRCRIDFQTEPGRYRHWRLASTARSRP